ELGAEAPAEAGRARAQIEDPVPQRALDAAHQLYLGRLAELVMHAAQRAAVAAQRIVDLDKAGFESRLTEFALAEQAREKAALVLALVELDDVGAGEGRRDELHAALTRSRSRSRSRAMSAGRGGGARCAAGRICRHRNRLPRSDGRRIARAAPPCRRPRCIRAGSRAATGRAS